MPREVHNAKLLVGDHVQPEVDISLAEDQDVHSFVVENLKEQDTIGSSLVKIVRVISLPSTLNGFL